MPTEAERLATIEQVLRDVRTDVDELRGLRRDDHHRLRSVENGVEKLVEAQRIARAAEDRQYRRMEVRLQVLTAAVAVAALLEPFLYHFAQH